jgi:hypothetical protein
VCSVSLLIKLYHIVFQDSVTEAAKLAVRSTSEDERDGSPYPPKDSPVKPSFTTVRETFWLGFIRAFLIAHPLLLCGHVGTG